MLRSESAHGLLWSAAMRFGFSGPVLALGLLCFSACADDETTPDVQLSIGTASVSAATDAPEGLATIDATVEFDPNVDFEGASIVRVTLTRLPDGPTLDLDTIARGPQGTASIDLPAGQITVARVSNSETRNGDLAMLCNAAATLTVTAEIEELEREASRDLTVSCS